MELSIIKSSLKLYTEHQKRSISWSSLWMSVLCSFGPNQVPFRSRMSPTNSGHEINPPFETSLRLSQRLRYHCHARRKRSRTTGEASNKRKKVLASCLKRRWLRISKAQQCATILLPRLWMRETHSMRSKIFNIHETIIFLHWTRPFTTPESRTKLSSRLLRLQKSNE